MSNRFRDRPSFLPDISEIKGTHAFEPVWQLQDFRMRKRSDRILVAIAPVLFHGTPGELEILCDAFVTLAVVDQLNDVADFVIRFLLK